MNAPLLPNLFVIGEPLTKTAARFLTSENKKLEHYCRKLLIHPLLPQLVQQAQDYRGSRNQQCGGRPRLGSHCERDGGAEEGRDGAQCRAKPQPFSTLFFPPKFCSLKVPMDAPDLKEWVPRPNFVNRLESIEKVNKAVKEMNKKDGLNLVNLYLASWVFL